MAGSPDTLLRTIRAASLAEHDDPRVLGVDDFAFRRGHRYGTILVDLERRCVIDLLPDRKPETLIAWLEQHAHPEVISRDRGGSYAEAARPGAPDAVQVADRFHLLKNLTETLETFFLRHRSALRVAATATAAERAPPESENLPQDEMYQGKRRSPQNWRACPSARCYHQHDLVDGRLNLFNSRYMLRLLRRYSCRMMTRDERKALRRGSRMAT
jgi:transposase